MRAAQEPVDQVPPQPLPTRLGGRRAARAAQVSRLWGIAERPTDQLDALMAALLSAYDDGPLSTADQN